MSFINNKKTKVGINIPTFYDMVRTPINQGGSAPTTDENGNNTNGASGVVSTPNGGDNLVDVTPNDVTNLTKNPEVTYSDSQLQEITAEDALKMRKIIYKNVLSKQNKLPPGYYNNLIYEHRKSIAAGIGLEEFSDKLFRLGDCTFVLPPEFISISNTTTSERVQGIRESSSSYISNGYIQKDIQVNLTLNGLNQINGYRVESPFSYKYYVDGLRTLLSQFRFTPFVPVENLLLNAVHDIHFVALRNISVQTIPGFPETLNIMLHLQNFDTESLVPVPSDTLTDMIDWDIFRWYTQRPLTEEPCKTEFKKVLGGKLTANIKLSAITLEAIEMEVAEKENDKQDIDFINLLDDKNFSTIIDTTDESGDGSINLVGVSFSCGNNTPIIQLAAQESPLMQYLGCTDYNFVLDFEVLGQDKALLFKDILSHTMEIVRENRFLNGTGFVKIDNELINLTGTRHVMIKDVQHTTVPGFPDLYNVKVNCTSCDTNTTRNKTIEGFKGLKGDGDGTMSDVFSTDIGGLSIKLFQDLKAEEELQKVELYKDLELPTYDKVDEVISAIKKWRKSKGFEENILIDKLIRPTYQSSLKKEKVEYNGFVDPDFYFFYDLNIDCDFEETDESDESDESDDNNNEERELARNRFVEKYRKLREISEIPNLKEITKDVETLVESGIDINSLTDFNKLFDEKNENKAKPDVATEPEFVWGWEPWIRSAKYKGMLSLMLDVGTIADSITGAAEGIGGYDPSLGQGSGGSGVGEPTVVKKKTGNIFVDYLCDRADSGCGYLWAAHGQMCTEELWNATKRQYGEEVNNVSKKWVGKQVFDCSGFVSWGLCKVGFKPKGWRTTTGGYIAMKNISKSELRCGDILVTSRHAAVYIGNGKTVESMNSQQGVCYGELGNRFTNFVRPEGLEECINNFIQNNPQVYSYGGGTASSNSNSSQNIRTRESRVPTVSTGTSDNEEQQIIANLPKTVLADFGGGNACDKWNSFIIASCKKYNLDPNFIKCIISIESNGNPNAKNGIPCVGLMQINLNCHKVPGGDPYDPAANIDYGCKVWEDYRKISYVGNNIERWMCAYNAGPGTAESVFVKKTRSLPSETVNYIRKYRELYAKLSANGGRAGATNTPGGPSVSGGSSNGDWGGLGGIADIISGTISSIWEITSEFFKNPNAFKKHCEEIANVKMEKFGEPFYEKIAEYAESGNVRFIVGDTPEWMQSGNSDLAGATGSTPNIGSTGTYNPVEPTDDPQSRMPLNPGTGGDITGENNGGNSGHDGQIVVTPGLDPNDTRDPIIVKPIKYDKESAKINKTDEIIEYMFVDEVKYSKKGSMLRAFPTYLITIIDEQSDWHDTKKLWSNYYICNNLINLEVLQDYSTPTATCTMQLSNFYNNLTASVKPTLLKDVAFDDDDYIRKAVYEWTGAIIDEEITEKMLELKNKLHKEIRLQVGARLHVRLGYGSNPDDLPTVFNGHITDLEDGEILNVVAQDDGKELVSSLMTDKQSATSEDIDLGEEVSNIVVELLCRRESDFLYAFTWGNFEFNNAYNISHFGFHFYTSSGMNHLQYDLIKNIYNGTYEGVHYYKYPLNPFDGESNYRFMVNNKTPWDVMKMCEKAMPEFVAHHRPFGFESRVFFGLPNWLCKYKSVKGEDGIYELAKSFAQAHIIHSSDSIIDNTIKVSTKNHFTNAIGVYCLGGDVSTTPIIYSDFRIDAGKQVTKTIDTTSVQDFGFVPGFIDKAIEWIGAFDNGKNMAIKICISEILDSWKNIYRGNIILVGQAEIRPYDYLFVEDTFLKINGPCTVRNVMHSLNIQTGFITTVAPGLIGANTLKVSGLTNVIRTTLATSAGVMTAKRLSGALISTYRKYKTKIVSTKFGGIVSHYGKRTFNFLKGKGSSIWKGFKTGRIVTNVKSFAKAVDAAHEGSLVIKGLKKIKTIASVSRKAVVAFVGANIWNPAGWIGLAVGLLVDMIVNIFLTWIIDEFRYRNCVTLYPMFRTLPDGKTVYLVGSHFGSKDLIPFGNKAGYEDTTDVEE